MSRRTLFWFVAFVLVGCMEEPKPNPLPRTPHKQQTRKEDDVGRKEQDGRKDQPAPPEAGVVEGKE